MSVEIRFAENDKEHRDAYRLRAQVFAGEGILDRSADELLFDTFDTLPSSRTMVAVDDGLVVGTVRVTSAEAEASPVQDWFDPTEVFPDGAVVGYGSMLCVAPTHRRGTLGLRLVNAAMANQRKQGSTHGVAPIRPEAEPIFRRLGWFRVDEPFDHPIERVPVVPMGVDLWAGVLARV
jgi:GNAT superfamily N-acetyltransferase